MSLQSEIKRDKMRVFRRLYMKRRVGADYEADWQLIPARYIMKWGNVDISIDDIKPNQVNIGGFDLTVRNNDGYFSDVEEARSFFYGSNTRYKTLVKIQAGYKDDSGTELPTETTLFIGYIAEDMKYREDNTIEVQCKHLSGIFEEIPSDYIQGLGPTMTAAEIIGKIRDYIDATATNVAVFQKYITSGGWTIASTSNEYNMSTSTTLQGKSTWELMKNLAEAEQHVVYVSRVGNLHFESMATSSAEVYHFSGVGDSDNTYGHNVMGQIAIEEPIRKVYNRVRIKHEEGDTTTSYYIKNETYQWGASVSSYYYGVRTYELDNILMTPTCAQTVGDAIYTTYKWPAQEVTLKTKFVPQLWVNDTVSLTYKTKTFQSGYQWGLFDWGEGFWARRQGFNINIEDSAYKIIKIKHSVEEFSSEVVLRAI